MTPDRVPGPPTAWARVPGDTWLSYVAPEEAGFSAEKLAEAYAFWESIQSAALLVIYQGAVLVNWGETARRFRCHSVRKSFMSAMYGVYIDNGGIDTAKTLEALGIDDDPPLTEMEQQARIVDLLSARSGVYRPAAYAPRQSKPPRGSYPPGAHWVYNNWDFNTLLTILEQETGEQFFDAFGRLFAVPLRMQDYHPSHGYYHYEWDKSTHPAYPFRMSARDMARFGLLYLHQGCWGHQRLLSEAYVKLSTSRVSTLTRRDGIDGYGYLWWRHGAEPFSTLGMYSARGSGGHTIDVMPGADMVCVHRVDTYSGHRVSPWQYHRLLRMILEAQTGPAPSAPRLVPLSEPEPAYQLRSLEPEARPVYVMDAPIPTSDQTVRILEDDGELWIEFGQGRLRLLPLGLDHFMVEDFQYHLYFETADDGSKRLIFDYLLLQSGRAEIERGEFDAGLVYYDKAARYYPDAPHVHLAAAWGYWQKAREAIEHAVAHHRKVTELRPWGTRHHIMLAWELISLQAQMMPPDLSARQLQRFAGVYGPRRVEYEDGALYYSRDNRPRVKLTPLTGTIFADTIDAPFRLQFETYDDGRVFGLTGLYRSGRRDHHLRDEM